MFAPIYTAAAGAAGAAAGGAFDRKGKQPKGEIAMQRGGTVMGVPADKVGQYMQAGWTDQGDLVKDGNNKIYAMSGTNDISAYLAEGGGGQPKMPEYADLIDPTTGLLKSQYQITKGADVTSNYDAKSLNALKDIGMSAPGSSAWEKMMIERQGLSEATGRDKAVRGADTSRLSAMSQLATSGGLTNSARERLASGAGSSLMSAKQDIARQGAMDRLGIGTEAEKNRMSVLSALPGMELSRSNADTTLGLANRDYATGVEKANIGSALERIKLQDVGKYTNYKAQMDGWAGNQQANAISNSGGGPSWICTEVSRINPFTDAEWMTLNNLKAFFQKEHPEVANFYFGEHGCELVRAMKANEVNFQPFRKIILRVIEHGDNGRYQAAIRAYWNFSKVMFDAYLPDFPAPEYSQTEEGLSKFMHKESENRYQGRM